MPRNGAGIFSLDSRYLVSEGDTILPSQHNPVLEDIQTDANTPRPIVAGGTGASTATTARTNLSVYSKADVDDGFTAKVATRTALKALDTATVKAVVLTEATRQKLFMWTTGDFTDETAADTTELNYIPADGVAVSLGCWVAVTGKGASIVPITEGGTGESTASEGLAALGGMASATYDPTSVAGDAFDMANMVEATDAKIMTAAERTKLAKATLNDDADVSGNSWVNSAGPLADSAETVPAENVVKAYVDGLAVKAFDAVADAEAATIGTGVDTLIVAGRNYVRVAEDYELLGPEILTNGDFATDAVWTKGSGWSISGGSAAHAVDTVGAYITQNVAFESAPYFLRYMRTGAGPVIPVIAGVTQYLAPTTTSAGTFEAVIENLDADNFQFRFYADKDFAGTIDDVSVKKLPAGSFQSADGAWWGPAGATMNTDTDVSDNSWVLDEDDMASDSATKVPTQQSVNAGKLQKVADRAALLSLNTDVHTSVYVRDRGVVFEWDEADLSGTILNADVVSTAVDSATDTITSAGHGLRTCDAVLVSTAVDGLSVNTLYYVIYIDEDNFQLATSRANALAATAVDLTGTSAVTVNEHRDPDQNVYATPASALDGSSGSWVSKSAESERRGWANSVPPANIRRLGDRILVGRGATDWNGLIKLSGGAGSWLFGEGEGTQQMHYLLVNAAIAGVSDNFDGKDSPYGVFGAARTPGGASSQGAIGITGYAKGDATSGASVAWAGYLDAVKGSDSNTTTEGLEIEVTNLNSTPAAYRTPYSTYAQGRTYGLVIGTGADVTVHPTSYDADTALLIFDNGAKFRNGIVFDYTSLTADATTGYQHAIALANKQLIEWYFGAVQGNIGFAINCEISDNAHAMRLIADDAGHHLYSVAGAILWEVGYVASAVNGLRLRPAETGVSPVITPKGSDTNIGLDIDVKGTGLGRLRGGDSLAKLRWSTTGIGFLGAAELPRQTVSGSRADGTALASLLTKLANFGLITDSSTA